MDLVPWLFGKFLKCIKDLIDGQPSKPFINFYEELSNITYHNIIQQETTPQKQQHRANSTNHNTTFPCSEKQPYRRSKNAVVDCVQAQLWKSYRERTYRPPGATGAGLTQKLKIINNGCVKYHINP